MLPHDGDDYPLWLLVAAKKALFQCMDDPELGDARWVLGKIDEALSAHQPTGITGEDEGPAS